MRGEPIVRAPEDAFRWFLGWESSGWSAAKGLPRKDRRDQRLKIDYKVAFEPE
jgi:carbamoyltransferase